MTTKLVMSKRLKVVLDLMLVLIDNELNYFHRYGEFYINIVRLSMSKQINNRLNYKYVISIYANLWNLINSLYETIIAALSWQ
jgi:hypothetical protein